jgi:hypothetical protein
VARSEKRGSEARLEKEFFKVKKKEVRLKKRDARLKKRGAQKKTAGWWTSQKKTQRTHNQFVIPSPVIKHYHAMVPHLRLHPLLSVSMVSDVSGECLR